MRTASANTQQLLADRLEARAGPGPVFMRVGVHALRHISGHAARWLPAPLLHEAKLRDALGDAVVVARRSERHDMVLVGKRHARLGERATRERLHVAPGQLGWPGTPEVAAPEEGGAVGQRAERRGERNSRADAVLVDRR